MVFGFLFPVTMLHKFQITADRDSSFLVFKGLSQDDVLVTVIVISGSEEHDLIFTYVEWHLPFLRALNFLLMIFPYDITTGCGECLNVHFVVVGKINMGYFSSFSR